MPTSRPTSSRSTSTPWARAAWVPRPLPCSPGRRKPCSPIKVAISVTSLVTSGGAAQYERQ
eukprot:34449-Eustigmatos_ZCMA.PRE.1